MLARRPPLLLVALVLVGLGATGCGDQSAAVQVGDETLSESDLLDETKVVANNDALLQLYQVPSDAVSGDAAGTSYSQEFVGFVLQQKIGAMLLGQLLDNEGLTVGQADREAAVGQLEGAFTQVNADFDDLPEGYRDQFVDDYATQLVLDGELGSSLQQELIALANDTEIRVNARYGTWDSDQLQIVPPDGPQPSPDSPSEADEADETGSGSPEAP